MCSIGVDFKVKTIVLDNKRVKLSIWVRTKDRNYFLHIINLFKWIRIDASLLSRIQLARKDSELLRLATTVEHRGLSSFMTLARRRVLKVWRCGLMNWTPTPPRKTLSRCWLATRLIR